MLGRQAIDRIGELLFVLVVLTQTGDVQEQLGELEVVELEVKTSC